MPDQSEKTPEDIQYIVPMKIRQNGMKLEIELDLEPLSKAMVQMVLAIQREEAETERG